MNWLKDLGVSRQTKDCLAALDIIGADFEDEFAWPVLKPLVAEAVRKNDKLVCSKILREGILPRDVVLTLIANIALNKLGSGEYHTHRGILSMTGNSYRVIFSSIVSLQKMLGTITEEERDIALSNMTIAVAEAG